MTPVDIPLFQKTTIDAVLKKAKEYSMQEKIVIKPSYGKRGGHPLFFSKALATDIFTYQGEEGLKQVLLQSKPLTAYIETMDKGILLDADTKEAFEQLNMWYKMSLHSIENKKKI